MVRGPSGVLMLRSFGSVLRRDITVTGKDPVAFLAQVLLQPVLFLFVFGRLLTGLGYLSGGYASLLFPGLVALTATVTAIQASAFHLVAEFGWTREIEDRLLAPLPLWAVAAEKVVFAAIQALVAAAVMFPIGIGVLGSVPYRAAGLGLLAGVLGLGSLVGACIGLTIGTFVPPTKISLGFALIFTPLLFTSATQYPWPLLTHLRWFQVLTAANPITYVSEGMRATLAPAIPHIPGWVCLLTLTGSLVLFATIGMIGFRRCAID
ncbi:MAG: ABC transporter permease [Pseudonocardiales bacterium]|nr:ABC transporter permease [Pseudonocardiales bacterium]MBV9029748.1 ABC transporter permease [Pseudonocardiales bacterium]MBW0010694.1 ABC transporter permease [Pseudonocardiales bacterium]